MKSFFCQKHMEDLLVFFFAASDKGKKVKNLMKKWKRNDFVLLKTNFLSTDKQEVI